MEYTTTFKTDHKTFNKTLRKELKKRYSNISKLSILHVAQIGKVYYCKDINGNTICHVFKGKEGMEVLVKNEMIQK